MMSMVASLSIPGMADYEFVIGEVVWFDDNHVRDQGDILDEMIRSRIFHG